MTRTLMMLALAAALVSTLPSAAGAQDATSPAQAHPEAPQAQPPIAPRPPAAGADRPAPSGSERHTNRRHDERHAARDDDVWSFFFGRHGHRDSHHHRDRETGRRADTQSAAPPGAVPPPANGLFKNGASPNAQVD